MSSAESGKHVVTPCPYWYPFFQDKEAADQLQAACQSGKVNFHASGCNPGGIAERFPADVYRMVQSH